jgi:hypothetical protein
MFVSEGVAYLSEAPAGPPHPHPHHSLLTEEILALLIFPIFIASYF